MTPHNSALWPDWRGPGTEQKPLQDLKSHRLGEPDQHGADADDPSKQQAGEQKKTSTRRGNTSHPIKNKATISPDIGSCCCCCFCKRLTRQVTLLSTKLSDLIVQEPSMTKNSSSSRAPKTGAQLRDNLEREKCPHQHRRQTLENSPPSLQTGRSTDSGDELNLRHLPGTQTTTCTTGTSSP